MSEPELLNGRYQLLHTLGTGGMANVYKAKDLTLERTVAIKILNEEYSKDPVFRERFHQEAKAAANLSHPNIVTVYDFGLTDEHLFIVMEYMPGTDLKTLILQRNNYKIGETIDLMIQACAGIGYAHRAGLVHCDIKPHNILVSPDLRLKVTDFGIARALSTIVAEEYNEVVWGSPHYFSPEQAKGAAPSPASDVYSLGIILYEMLTGQLPFNAKDSTELARMHREDSPTPPRRINSAIPVTLEEIVLKVLSKEPSARYRTADQLGRLLTAFLASKEGGGTAPLIARTGPYRITPSVPIAANQSDEIETMAMPEENPSETKGKSVYSIKEAFKSVDLGTWGIGLLAFTMVLGLIPFWLYIYLTLNP